MTIPDEGCKYVAEKVATPAFLMSFLQVITTPGKNMADVANCFEKYAAICGTEVVREVFEEEDHGESYAFYMKDASVESYVYCVEKDEFGLTYHRFTRADYEKLVM